MVIWVKNLFILEHYFSLKSLAAICKTFSNEYRDKKPLNKKTITPLAERRGRMVNTPASYSGGSKFKCLQETSYPDWGF
jgi:hypothetical protein